MKGENLAVVLSRGGGALIQFFIVLYYASYLSTSEFGQLSILMIVVGLSYGLIDFGTANTVITRRIKKTVYGVLQLLNFSLALLIGLLLFSLSFLKIDYGLFEGGFFHALKYALPLYLVYSCTIVPYARIHKSQKLKILALVDFIPVSSLLITVPILLWLNFGLATLFISIGIQVILRFYILRYYYGSIIKFRIQQPLPLAVLARQYLSNFLVYLTSKLDQVMVASFLSPSSLGLYSFLKQVLNYPISLLIAIYTQITFPKFSRSKTKIKTIRHLLIKSSFLLVLAILFYFTFILLLPTKLMTNIIPMWGVRSELAVLIMLLSLARIAVDVLSSFSIAVGFVGRQLYINLTFLLITLCTGFLIPVLGINWYLLLLTGSAFAISIFIYITTFNRLVNGKNYIIYSL